MDIQRIRILVATSQPVIAASVSSLLSSEVEWSADVERLDIKHGTRFNLTDEPCDLVILVLLSNELGACMSAISKMILPSKPCLILSDLRKDFWFRPLLRSGISFVGMDEYANLRKVITSIVFEKHSFSNNPFWGKTLGDIFSQDWRLSNRETQVVKFLSKGSTSVHICQELGIKASTVSTTKKRAFVKLGVSSIAELVALNYF